MNDPLALPISFVALIASLAALYTTMTNLSARVSRLRDAEELLKLAASLDPEADTAERERLQEQAQRHVAIAWAYGEVREKRYILISVVNAILGGLVPLVAVEIWGGTNASFSGGELFALAFCALMSLVCFGFSVWCFLTRREYVQQAADTYPNEFHGVKPSCPTRRRLTAAALILSSLAFMVAFSLTNIAATSVPGVVASLVFAGGCLWALIESGIFLRTLDPGTSSTQNTATTDDAAEPKDSKSTH